LNPIWESTDMSELSEEFARYAQAEKHLCEEASCVLTAVIGDIEARAGLRITQFGVTIDKHSWPGGLSSANCKIVNARDAANSPSAKPPAGERL
jgi:hypothetical protein